MQSSGSEKCFTLGGRFSFAHSAVPGFVSHAATSSMRGCWKANMFARIAPKRPKPIKQILSRRSVAMLDNNLRSDTKGIRDVTSRNISPKQRPFNELLSYGAYILPTYPLCGGSTSIQKADCVLLLMLAESIRPIRAIRKSIGMSRECSAQYIRFASLLSDRASGEDSSWQPVATGDLCRLKSAETF